MKNKRMMDSLNILTNSIVSPTFAVASDSFILTTYYIKSCFTEL